jgi:hypothetical protein
VHHQHLAASQQDPEADSQQTNKQTSKHANKKTKKRIAMSDKNQRNREHANIGRMTDSSIQFLRLSTERRIRFRGHVGSQTHTGWLTATVKSPAQRDFNTLSIAHLDLSNRHARRRHVQHVSVRSKTQKHLRSQHTTRTRAVPKRKQLYSLGRVHFESECDHSTQHVHEQYPSVSSCRKSAL